LSIEKLRSLIRSRDDVTAYFIMRIENEANEVIESEGKNELDSELLNRILERINDTINFLRGMGVSDISLRFYLENRVVSILSSGKFIVTIIRKKQLTKDLEKILKKIGIS